MKKITVLYFAQFREQRGASEEQITTQASTAGDLYKELADSHGLYYDTTTVRVAVNEQLAEWETQVSNGDTVVFLAPFAGG